MLAMTYGTDLISPDDLIPSPLILNSISMSLNLYHDCGIIAAKSIVIGRGKDNDGYGKVVAIDIISIYMNMMSDFDFIEEKYLGDRLDR
jgi:hypothetical protein